MSTLPPPEPPSAEPPGLEPSLDEQTPIAPVPDGVPLEEKPGWTSKLVRRLVGAPRSVEEKGIFHALTLIPFLAWVGLGADGLSSSSYGPDEAFKALGDNTFLALGIAGMMVFTVVIISMAYGHIIEAFPHGGGGYVVATKLLGDKAGVISGCALLVDYMLTITTSIAAAGDALFSFLPGDSVKFLGFNVDFKLAVEIGFILILTTLNVRGVKESVITLTPIFIIFLITHAIVIVGGFAISAPHVAAVAHQSVTGLHHGLELLGVWGLFKLLIHSYSLGGGTYTGIEAVSNGVPLMREPKVQTAKRTMVLMAVSLAITAAGLLICYVLLGAHPEPNKTMNAVLLDRFAGTGPWGRIFTIVTLVSEGALLVVAGQAGFVDGPRVMANMAVDGWMPRRLAALSDRLTTQNGVLIMGVTSLAALAYTAGDVSKLVVMYSINVFLTFSLSMFAMLRRNLGPRTEGDGGGHTAIFAVGFLLCGTILCVTTVEKFAEGGWLTLLVTSLCVAGCFWVRSHYKAVRVHLQALDQALGNLPSDPIGKTPTLNPQAPTAIVLVASFGGLGLHTALNVFKSFPNYFKNIVFISAGVIDSGGFKGEQEIAGLKRRVQADLDRYVEFAQRMGMPSTSRMALGTDAVADVEELAVKVGKEFPRSTFFAGQIIFHKEKWYDRWLHNQTAFSIQKRLQWAGMTMVILPVRVR